MTCFRARYRLISGCCDIVRSTNPRSISRYRVIDMNPSQLSFYGVSLFTESRLPIGRPITLTWSRRDLIAVHVCCCFVLLVSFFLLCPQKTPFFLYIPTKNPLSTIKYELTIEFIFIFQGMCDFEVTQRLAHSGWVCHGSRMTWLDKTVMRSWVRAEVVLKWVDWLTEKWVRW